MNKTGKSQNKPTPEQVAALAYQIWEKGGRQPGHEIDNWLEAEKRLSAPSSAPPLQSASSPTSRNVVTETGSTSTNHLRRVSNGRQNALART